ncbi:MAG: hypothetical protein IH948_10580, partial [Bacteroidetes bacterium]|nr:hypothetical protein [Bacteroidota bacterium]
TENSYNEDDLFNFICFLNAQKVAITPNCYYHYYQRWGSITASFSRKHIDDLIDAFASLKEHLVDRNLYEVHKEAYFSYFNKCASFVLDMIVKSDQTPKTQNEYIRHFVKMARTVLSVSDYVEYLGARRIRDFLKP